METPIAAAQIEAGGGCGSSLTLSLRSGKGRVGVGRWFYERAAGSYSTLLSREGNTPSKLKTLKDAIPPARKVTKTDLVKYINAWNKKPDIVS